jgi:hypothetical protein
MITARRMQMILCKTLTAPASGVRATVLTGTMQDSESNCLPGLPGCANQHNVGALE